MRGFVFLCPAPAANERLSTGSAIPGIAAPRHPRDSGDNWFVPKGDPRVKGRASRASSWEGAAKIQLCSMQGGFFEEQSFPIPWDSPSPTGEASGAARNDCPCQPRDFNGSVCGNQQQQPWRGHGRAADSYPSAPMDAPINPLLPKAGREWERLRWAPLCPLTARLILGAFPVDEGWMSQPADRCHIRDVTAPSGNGATTKSSVGYGENGDPRGRIPVAPSLTQAGAHWPGQSLLLPTDVATSLGSSWSKAS